MSLLSPQKKLKERKGGIGELVVKTSQQSTETSINQALPQIFFFFLSLYEFVLRVPAVKHFLVPSCR